MHGSSIGLMSVMPISSRGVAGKGDTMASMLLTASATHAVAPVWRGCRAGRARAANGWGSWSAAAAAAKAGRRIRRAVLVSMIVLGMWWWWWWCKNERIPLLGQNE